VSDFFVFFLLLVLVLLNKFIKRRSFKIINNILLFLVLLLFIIDMFTFYYFQSRLSILDITQFISPSETSFGTIALSILALLCIWGIGAFLLLQQKRFRKNQRLFLAIGCSIFAFAAAFTSLYARSWFQLPQNVLSLNVEAIRDALFNPSIAIGSNAYGKYFSDSKWLHKSPNVIVVFAESLSAIDSLRVGKTYNNLPYFDKIQAQGITFTNFLANGCTSDTAHISLLQGVEPWKFAWEQDSAYTGYKSYTESLPRFFQQQGYTPIFVSAADLSFLNQRSFLSGIGFTDIVWEEAFKNQKKYVFDSAPDQDLYTQTLKVVAQQTKPYFLSLQTISFHKPFNSPYGDTEEDALRYSDKMLYFFYQQLRKVGFFDNGILIIVGDHRKMTPIMSGEKETLGPLRYGKALATVLWAGIHPWTINSNIVQHTDFFYALKQLIGKGNITLSRLFNDTFSFQKRRNWGLIFCRYFADKYGVQNINAASQTFSRVADLKYTYPFIYKYLQSYTAFQGPQLSSGQMSTWTISSQPAKRLTIIAHRGAPRGAAPENSLQAFLLAKKHGADGIEFDVSQTKDKQNIILHGDSLAASTFASSTCKSLKETIDHYTLQELKETCPLKNGEKIMTLEEFLPQVKDMFDYYFLDIKIVHPDDEAQAEQQTLSIIQTVQQIGMDDKIIFSSYDKTATYILWSYKSIHAGRDSFSLSGFTVLPHLAHEYYLMPQSLIKESTPQEVQDMGKKLVVYVVNTLPELDRLYHIWISMIMTDDVLAMREGEEKIFLEEK